MKNYFIQLVYFYIIYSFCFVECSIEYSKQTETECYCPCLTTESITIQTTIDDNDQLNTTDVNYHSTVNINNRLSTEKLIVSTQGETEKIKEIISTETTLKDKEKTKEINDTTVAGNINNTRTTSNVEETTTQKLKDKVETSTIFKYKTTDNDNENLSINGNETFIFTDEGELLTTVKKEQSTDDYHTTQKNENQAILKESKIVPKIPHPRSSQIQYSTQIPLVIKEERGIIFKIYIFIHNIKETIINKFFY